MTNPVLEAQRLGQSIWYDNIRRGLLTSGDLRRLVESGVTGVTSNPTIFEKAIAGSTDYDEALLDLVQGDNSAKELFEALALEDIRAAADLLLPIYERTEGVDGYVSMEVSPTLANDTDRTISEAQRLFAAAGRTNLLVKVPATPEGISAIQRLIGEGININVTLIFSLEVYRRVSEAYVSGLESLVKSGGDPSKVASVASFFVSRVDTAVDALLEERIRGGEENLKELLGKAAIANSKLAYRAFKETFDGKRFAGLKSKGAHPQRLLWASTGTKNPLYSDVLYVESLIGPHTVNTMPPATLTAFLEHGTAESTLGKDIPTAEQNIQGLADVGIDMVKVTDILLADGIKSFADSFEKLLTNIEDKAARLRAREHVHPGASLGADLGDVEVALADLQKRDVVGRIWRRDHTVWNPKPTEITNRLGWLNVTDIMSEQIPALESFAHEVLEAGYLNVGLLGMGGSSLGPEVLRQTFGSAPGYPELIVLDSTVPAWIRGVTEAIDPSKALFLVSSKSGGTIEPNTFYSHFRNQVEQVIGKERAGQNFVAITDPGTSLEKLAHEEGFRRVFSNPPDIGGRYSVLSYFGLVPAVLTGIDVSALLYRADCMREGCEACVPAHDNPGAWLGAAMGAIASKGRDKLTLVTSPGISSFGLWAEQLIAESTGKLGTGIIPVAGEPLLTPEHYGGDRLFVYLRVEDDDNARLDAAIERIESSGQPVMRLDLRDRYDLGAEFFRWEFATAVVGAILGIHPFDQPNVQAAKDMTGSVLTEFEASGKLPHVEAASGLEGLLSEVRSGDYLAIMAYVRQTPEVDLALNALRRKVMERHRIATTLGYGPRFLHSTGQLHKGGPNSGLFLQLTASHTKDLPIPGKPYTFGVLADAQALGDLQALQASGRRVASVRVDSEDSQAIHRLAAEIR